MHLLSHAIIGLAVVITMVVALLGRAEDQLAPERTMPSPYSLQTSYRQQVAHGLLLAVDGQRMWQQIDDQLRLGPRFLGSPGHVAVQNLLIRELETSGHEVTTQSWVHDGYDLTNVIGRLYPERERRIILATHYDSKMLADKDPTYPTRPVPGANDSASGVVVLLEVARLLADAKLAPSVGIDIVFFDGEEGDVHTGADYTHWKPLGSTYFAEHLPELYEKALPESGVVVDMVCDKDLRIDQEYTSARDAKQQLRAFWRQAQKEDPSVFSSKPGLYVQDDHTPLNAAGIPSFLLIDLAYLPFHTTEDTLDKCSPASLDTVASALIRYIYAIN